MLNKLGKAQCLNSIDSAKAYHWVKIALVKTHKITFDTNEGLYEYIIIPLSLFNARAFFQRLTGLTFVDKFKEFLAVYLYYILVYSKT